MLPLNEIINDDCLNILKEMPDDCVDLTVTSPPYDDLRNYKGYTFPFEEIAKELYRVTKQGGVVVWVVNDATIKGSETGTSFKQALYFKEIGFNLHDTMIYAKGNPTPNAGVRYQQCFEYMFVLSKGKPKTVNILDRPRKNNTGDTRTFRRNKKFNRDKEGNFSERDFYPIREFVPRENIWYYTVGLYNSTSDKVAFKHPAIFPEKLAEDHILSWSNEGDTVLDVFCGSGSTLKMAKMNNRNFIGVEISEEYTNIAKERLANYDLI